MKNACKKHGVHLAPTAKTEEYAKNIVESTGYDYIRGFENVHSKILIRCRKCGCEYERMYNAIWKEHAGYYPNKPQCPGCNKKMAEEKEKKRKAEAEREAQMRARQKAEQLSRQANEELARRLAIHVCKNCGKEYCISCTGYDSKTYCSKRCQSRWHDRMKNDKRMDRLKSRRHDTDITLERLYSRDGGVCYICGKQCDWSDGETVNGTFIAGDNYPSIDHVKPVAKGGTHTWDNIKLACRHCNTLKGWD